MLSSIVTLILLSISLAIDAFSVSLVDGLTLKNYNNKKMIFSSFIFGLFQALFPLLGYLLGLTFIKYIEAYDHWVAFALLLFIGLKMIIDAIKEIVEKKKDKNHEEKEKSFSYKLIIIQGIATAIDAFAVGITLETSIPDINVYISIAVIGLITFLLTLLSSFLGKGISKLIKGKVEVLEIIGGIVLILIGVKIVLSHLGIIPF